MTKSSRTAVNTHHGNTIQMLSFQIKYWLIDKLIKSKWTNNFNRFIFPFRTLLGKNSKLSQWGVLELFWLALPSLTSSMAMSLAVMVTGLSVLIATNTCRTVGQLCTAASTVFFSSVTFPPLTPWFTVMTVLDWAANGMKERSYYYNFVVT